MLVVFLRHIYDISIVFLYVYNFLIISFKIITRFKKCKNRYRNDSNNKSLELFFLHASAIFANVRFSVAPSNRIFRFRYLSFCFAALDFFVAYIFLHLYTFHFSAHKIRPVRQVFQFSMISSWKLETFPGSLRRSSSHSFPLLNSRKSW